jgi:hypothetical protein
MLGFKFGSNWTSGCRDIVVEAVIALAACTNARRPEVRRVRRLCRILYCFRLVTFPLNFPPDNGMLVTGHCSAQCARAHSHCVHTLGTFVWSCILDAFFRTIRAA